MSLTIAAILAAARTPRASTPCPTCGTGAGAISREEAENRLQKLGYQPHVMAVHLDDPRWAIAMQEKYLADADVQGRAAEHADRVALRDVLRALITGLDAPPCSCAGREAIRVLCAGLTDEQLRAEIADRAEQTETLARCEAHAERSEVAARYRTRLVDARHARAALETERDRRSHEAAIATLPEDRR